ncbi:hypothetical protein [Paraburkholderia tropica]|uniref:hypothetical protein n=1 Tax=Paraburkholderia tropica TaxID=92647 RepID=UPI002AB7472F|nr:hypothetical protein [Paraburkholderia tropica]
MKVRELIEALSKVDPEADVCCFTDERSGAKSLEYVALWEGVYDRRMKSNAMRYEDVQASFVGLLNPGDFEHDGTNFKLVKNLRG